MLKDRHGEEEEQSMAWLLIWGISWWRWTCLHGSRDIPRKANANVDLVDENMV